MNEFITKFLTDNTPLMKCLRTIFQGIIAAIIANLDVIIGSVSIFTPEQKTIIVALIMAVLSPIMATIKGDKTE